MPHWLSQRLIPTYGLHIHPGECSGRRWLIVQGDVPFEHRTEYVILDAQCVEKGPVCRLKLAMHIPISFHGTFTHNVFTHPEPVVSKL
ncbi:hypothetical protein DIPPA_07204 [Diplonema papillatum]|nr:hypothetical protein DIPPA_07204 [Diplonema papillatum]